jgi:hypothetical protein
VGSRVELETVMDTTTLLIILIVLFVLGGGFYGRGSAVNLDESS